MSGKPITIDNVQIDLGGKPIVSNASLQIEAGEFICMLGPSGCGKSTLLNVLAGFLAPTAGSVRIGGEPVTGPSIDHGVVFQSAEVLFPWLTVRQNVEFGPRMRGMAQKTRREISDRFIALVGLPHVADRLPGELSGGMRQRVQIARVLANEPSVVLMDEPFGALDAQTREVMQGELTRICRENKPTVVFITHDISEALLLADRIVTMTAGPAAGLKSITPVELAHPRDLICKEAMELHKRLRDEIGEEVARTLRAQGLLTEASR